MSFEPEKSVLLLVDLQQRLLPAIADGGTVVANALRLARAARLLGIPVFATEQNPAGLGFNVTETGQLLQATVLKQDFDATREAAWATFMPPARPHVVVAGCEAHVCVLQTVLGMLGGGGSVRLVRDAIGSRTIVNRDAAAHRAERAGAELVTTEMVIFEWLATAGHRGFRDVRKLVK